MRGKTFTVKFPSNLKQHLKVCQLPKNENKQKEEKRLQKHKVLKASTGSTKGLKILGEVFQQNYDKDCYKYQDITQKMAIFIGSCNVPSSLGISIP